MKYGDVGEDEGFLVVDSPCHCSFSEGFSKDFLSKRRVEENSSRSSLTEDLTNGPIVERIDSWSLVGLDPGSVRGSVSGRDNGAERPVDLDSSFTLVTFRNIVVS